MRVDIERQERRRATSFPQVEIRNFVYKRESKSILKLAERHMDHLVETFSHYLADLS